MWICVACTLQNNNPIGLACSLCGTERQQCLSTKNHNYLSSSMICLDGCSSSSDDDNEGSEEEDGDDDDVDGVEEDDDNNEKYCTSDNYCHNRSDHDSLSFDKKPAATNLEVRQGIENDIPWSSSSNNNNNNNNKVLRFVGMHPPGLPWIYSPIAYSTVFRRTDGGEQHLTQQQ